MRGLRPNRNEWTSCRTVVQNVQRWAVNRCSRRIHDEKRSGQLDICTQWWPSPKCWLKIYKRRLFTFSELQFPHISGTFRYDIIILRLSYHTFCARWVSKILTGEHKTQRIAPVGFDFLQQYHKDGETFLSHTIRVTGDETWGSFVNIEKESSRSNGLYSSSKQKRFKHLLSARTQMATAVCYRKECWWRKSRKGPQQRQKNIARH